MDKMVDTATWFDELTRSRAKGKVGFIFCNVRLSTLRSVHTVRQQLRFFLVSIAFLLKVFTLCGCGNGTVLQC